MIRRLLLSILPKVASWLPKNRTSPERKAYPQLWYYMPRRWVEMRNEYYPNGNRKLRRAKPRLVIEWFCGHLTGHEISKTETGYDGSSFFDCSCRWCDKSFKVPVLEVLVKPEFKEFMKLIRKPGENENA